MTGFETIPAAYLAREKRTFLRIAQSNSRAAMRGSDEYIEGLLPGQFFSNNGVVLGDSVELIMLKFYASIQVRESAMMMAKNVATISVEEFEKLMPLLTKTSGGFWLDKDGRKYEEQANFVVLAPKFPELGAMILPMKSSELGMARLWLQLAMRVQNPNTQGDVAPMWSSLWNLKTKLETKQDKKTGGKFTFYVIDSINRVGWIPKNISLEVQEIFNEVQATPVLYTPMNQTNLLPAGEQVQPVTIGKPIESIDSLVAQPIKTVEFEDDIPF